MEYRAPATIVKDVDAQARRVLRTVDLVKQSREVRELVGQLRQSLHDARLYAVDYELSETRQEQLNNAKLAKECLKQASEAILGLSQYELFSPVDVAHLGALIEQTRADLK